MLAAEPAAGEGQGSPLGCLRDILGSQEPEVICRLCVNAAQPLKVKVSECGHELFFFFLVSNRIYLGYPKAVQNSAPRPSAGVFQLTAFLCNPTAPKKPTTTTGCKPKSSYF